MLRTLYRQKKSATDIPVQPNASYTPAQMMKMAEQGIAITTENLPFRTEQGERNPSFTPPLEHRRGIDMADMWQYQYDTRQKMSQAHTADRDFYGDNFTQQSEKQ